MKITKEQAEELRWNDCKVGNKLEEMPGFTCVGKTEGVQHKWSTNYTYIIKEESSGQHYGYDVSISNEYETESEGLELRMIFPHEGKSIVWLDKEKPNWIPQTVHI